MKAVSFLSTLFRLSLMSLLVAVLFGANPLWVALALALLSIIIPTPRQSACGVVLEVWANYLIERFWKDNGFLKNAYDDSQYVLQGRIVHIPQPGSKPAVVKNRSVFPATAVRRTDTDIVYALDEYSTDPTHIPNIDRIHLSYNKQDAVLGDHMGVLNETVAEDMILKWAANGTVVKTTGGATAAQVAPVTGQTGNRLGLHHSDLSKLMVKMNAAGVPKQDRNVLIDDNMYGYFYDSLGENQQRDFSKMVDAEKGIVGRIHGFNIMTRMSVALANNSDAIKALGASIASTDNLVSLAWWKNAVTFAIGDTKLFQNANDALYYGDVHSALVMAGGRVRRADGIGIYNIIQGTPA